MWILLILVVGLIGFAVALGVSAALQPRIRRARNLTQIEAYGYAGKPEAPPKRRGCRRASRSTSSRAQSGTSLRAASSTSGRTRSSGS